MYRYTDEARHGHVTLSKVCESHKFYAPANAVFDALEGDLVRSSRVARGPEAKRRKYLVAFLNKICTWVADWSCGIFPVTVRSVGLR